MEKLKLFFLKLFGVIVSNPNFSMSLGLDYLVTLKPTVHLNLD